MDSNQVDCVYSGDDIYCSIGRSDRGLHIKTIDGFVDSINNLQVEKCSIKIYKPERGYGFAFIGTTSNEAFFIKQHFLAILWLLNKWSRFWGRDKIEW